MKPELSRLETASAIRRFMYIAVVWAICDNLIYPSGLVFSRLILSMGGKMQHVGYLSSLVAFAGLTQLASIRGAPRVLQRNRNNLLFGALQGLCIAFIIIPLIAKSLGLISFTTAFFILGFAILTAYSLGNFQVATLTQWLGQVIPESTRAQYVSRRTALYNITAVAAITLTGFLLDAAEGHEITAFCILFTAAALGCITGYALLYRTPRPAILENPPQSMNDSKAKFSREYYGFIVFYCFWFFALAFAQPFYNAYMLESLGLSNRAVAMMSNTGVASCMVGTLLAGLIIDKFGSRGLIQIMILPFALSRYLWVFTTTDNALWLIPVMWVIGGLSFGIIFTAAYSLLFKLTPTKSVHGAKYFAMFWIATAAANITGPACGSFLLGQLQDVNISFFGISPDATQIVILISAILLTLSLGATFFIREKAAGPRLILGHIIRGNIMRFAYNYALFHSTRDGHKRAKAVRGAARSKSPAASGLLHQALSDPNKKVRSEAVKGLGHSRDSHAEEALIFTLDDNSSDIRPEAAKALGNITSGRAIQRLSGAMYDEDLRVRLGAVSALAGIGTEQALKALQDKLNEPLDKDVFPSLVDALTSKGNMEAAITAIKNLPHFPSYSVRMQLASAVCRAFGDRSTFYSLLGKNTLARTRAANTMLKANLGIINSLYGKSKRHGIVKLMVENFVNENFRGFMDEMAAFTFMVLSDIADFPETQSYKIQAAAEILTTYVKVFLRDTVTDEDWMFTLTIFTCLVRILASCKR